MNKRLFLVFFIPGVILVALVATLAYQMGIERGRLALVQSDRKYEVKHPDPRDTTISELNSVSEIWKRLYEAERKDRQIKDRQIGIIENSMAELCGRSRIKPNLKIYYNRQELEPWTPIRIFNADAMPKGKFTDRNGYIFPHHARVGERAIFLGKYDCGAVLVYCIDGSFAGRVMTFVPWETYIKQGALVYHF
jgi:hypothetical protein